MPAGSAGSISPRPMRKRPRHSRGNLFGWTPYEHPANGGSFTRLRLWDQDVGSLYQLRRVLLDHGIPSHWTPYVRVDDVENAVQRGIALGGSIIADPFVVSALRE